MASFYIKTTYFESVHRPTPKKFWYGIKNHIPLSPKNEFPAGDSSFTARKWHIREQNIFHFPLLLKVAFYISTFYLWHLILLFKDSQELTTSSLVVPLYHGVMRHELNFSRSDWLTDWINIPFLAFLPRVWGTWCDTFASSFHLIL